MTEFLVPFLVFLACCALASVQPLVAYFWEARPSVQRAREEEAERRAQAELRRVLLIEAECKARAQRPAEMFVAVGQAILPVLEEHANRAARLADSIHQQRIRMNIAHFFWGVGNIAAQILAEERGPEESLACRATLRRAEIAEIAASLHEREGEDCAAPAQR